MASTLARALRRASSWLACASLLACGATNAAIATTATVPTRLAWLKGADMVVVQRPGASSLPSGTPLKTPLGSVWKLFVYAYLSGRDAQEPPYRCESTHREADDEYCCDPGSSITRDEALARSCGPYFEPSRVGIRTDEWRRFWNDAEAPAWLFDLQRLQPGTDVPVADLLQALAQMPASSRLAARRALLPLSLRDGQVLASLGSGPRFKTWSWHVGRENAGGAAGWLADGTPFWFSAAGASRHALRQQASWIAAQWQAHDLVDVSDDAATLAAQPCIEVDFFSRYPIESVTRSDGSAAATGPMRGRYVVAFRSGSRLRIDASPELHLSRGASGPVIAGRLLLEAYVARVVDREGSGRETDAARALAVAARTYALQNAGESEGCRHIADDSHNQRVSPNVASDAAREAAAFTEDLVVRGTAVQYHADRAGANVMSWRAAVAASRNGEGFEAILRAAYPGGTLGGWQAGDDCEPLPEAAAWLIDKRARWRDVLRAQAGYEPPSEAVQVCRLAFGVPHSDQRRLLIRVREWQTREGRVTLIHEYLHLAFRNHPRGQDDAYVEQLAQRLADL